jgi:hypothetical protein
MKLTGKYLRQVDLIRGHLWHIRLFVILSIFIWPLLSVLLRFTNSDPLVSSNYSVAVNQVVCSPAAIFYQENPKMMVLLTWLCELHVQVLLECCYKWMRNLQLKRWNHIVCRTIWIKIEITRMTCLNIRLVISMLTIFIIETQLEF